MELSWSDAAIMLPAVQDVFEKLREMSLHISLELPNTPPGDGDGLCERKVQELHGLFVND